MQTACPHCKTIFRLTDTQLGMADGVVRCGMCQQTFNALAKPAETKATSDSNDATRELLDEPMREVIPEAFRKPSRGTELWSGLAWSVLILLLALTLAGEYTWFHRDQLQQHAELKPWLEKACGYLHCQLEPLREPDKIEMLSRNVYSHPTVKNALMVKVSMINHADHEQPYPDVRIDFSDVRGGLIAARRFTPAEYLATANNNHQLLAAGSEASFTLEIQDPGKAAMTYEFSFL